MTTSASPAIDPAEHERARPPVGVTEQRLAGAASYTVSGARSYAVTNLGADGTVTLDGVALPDGFSFSAELLPAGSVYADCVVDVAAGSEALVTESA